MKGLKVHQAVYMAGKDRIAFGTDFPAYHPGPEIAEVLDVDLSPEQVKKIVGENIAKILKLA